MSTISVVIPTYNGEAFVAEALRSVMTQTRLPEEIMVVDDASTDGTVEVVRAVAAESAVPIRLLQRSVNSGGPATPLNEGIAAAQGDYIALLDQDDLMLPEKLAEQAGALDAHADVELALSNYELFTAEGVILGCDARPSCAEASSLLCREPGPVYVVEAVDCLIAFFTHNALPRSCTNQFFRKRFWQRAGGYDARAGAPADYVFLTRAISGPVAWIDRVLFQKRRHCGNLWKSTFVNRLCILRAEQNTCSRFPDCAAMRRLVVQKTLDMVRELRWSGQYRLALVESLHLFQFGRPKAAVVELVKTCGAMVRARLA